MIAITIGTTGTVCKSLGQHLNNIEGRHGIKELQETVILGSAYILRKGYQMYSTCEITLHYSTAYILRKVVI